MRSRRVLLLLSVSVVLFIVYIIHPFLLNIRNNNVKLKQNSIDVQEQIPNIMTVAVVACGQRLQDALSMIKSALLFNQGKNHLHFIVFAEDHLRPAFEEKLGDWRLQLPTEFNYEILPLQFPPNTEKEWRSLFKPCAAQRLFLPSILRSTDSLLYVDTDTVFLSPVADIWQYFHRFNETQMAALTPEHEDENAGWYNRFARHPYYGKLGVNSGVMLMNLTRMRDFGWEARVQPIYTEYKLRITWGDQDIINIFFYYHPEKLYIMPCEYNYRPDHCMYMSVCNVSQGIKIMHGNRGYFQSGKQPLFRTIYEAIESYQINAEPYKDFIVPLQAALQNPIVTESNCGVVAKNSVQVAAEIFLSDYSYKT